MGGPQPLAILLFQPLRVLQERAHLTPDRQIQQIRADLVIAAGGQSAACPGGHRTRRAAQQVASAREFRAQPPMVSSTCSDCCTIAEQNCCRGDGHMADSLADRAQTVLSSAEPSALGLDPDRLERLYAMVETHVAEGRYPGAQLAIARHGRLAAFRTFGQARLDPPTPASDQTLWLLYSQTKPVVSAAVWQLVDQGALSFADKVADHIPEFARNGKGLMTVHQVIT